MSHDIDQTTGRPAIAYRQDGGTPWHGLGTGLTGRETLYEIKVKAGLDWPVNLSQVEFQRQPGQYTPVPERQVMYRGDTGAVLDVVGKDYVPHQNEEVLEFFREYLDAGEMVLDTAGSLKGGKMVWGLGKMTSQFELPGGDLVGGYVLLMNPHQYGKGMIAKYTSVRVVCHNTITMALNEAGTGGSVKIWHTAKFDEARRQEAKARLGIARDRHEAFQQQAETLVGLRLDRDQAVKTLAEVFGGDVELGLDEQPRTVKRLVELYEGQGIGATLEAAQGTGWGLLNAVTQFIDHEQGRLQDNRLINAWLGQGEVKKRQVMTELLSLARG